MDLLARVSIVCFASSYTVTLGLEITRLFFRLPVRWLLIVGFAAAGLFTHTLYLGFQAASGSAAPLSSWYHWCLLAAWVLAAGYLVRLVIRPGMATGLFVLPVILGLLAAGYAARELAPFNRHDASLYWGRIHGVALLLGTVAVSLGFVNGLMYLVHSWRLKHKLLPWQGMKFPSLETLQRVNEWCLISSAVLLFAGLVSGVVLGLVRTGAVSWQDPVISSSALLFFWVAAAVIFNAFYRPARQGRKVAYLTIAGFVFLAVALAFALIGPHGKQPPQTGPSTVREDAP